MLKAHSQTVSSIAYDNKDIIITGSKKGDTKLWKIDQEALNWEQKVHNFHHDDMVTQINIHSKLGLYVTASLDGLVNLYNMKG